jgi:hypothetical protein
MENEYIQYINMMKEIYLESHESINGFTEWFETTQELCEIMCPQK